MGRYDDFMKDPEPGVGIEKILGSYGCKYCKKDIDHAFWDESKFLLFWICPNEHRSEQQLV